MNSNLLVHCQYYENYNDTGSGAPQWKPKGGHTFWMPVDSDTVFYTDGELLVQAIKNLVETQNTDIEKFEYIEHELLTTERSTVDGLEEELERLYKLQY